MYYLIQKCIEVLQKYVMIQRRQTLDFLSCFFLLKEKLELGKKISEQSLLLEETQLAQELLIQDKVSETLF